MSTRWEVTKAVRRSGLPAPARLVMLVLADVAEAGTAEIPEQLTPSLRVLADETGLNESTVKRHLLALEKDGWVKRERPTIDAARKNYERTRYRLLVPNVEGAEEAQTVAQSEPSQGAEEAQPGRRESHYKDLEPSLLNPLLPHSSAADEIKPSKQQRGTRIPDDFAITAEMRAWAVATVPQLAGSRETEKFVNYWQAKSGREAVKIRWDLTWRNWMLNAAERQSPNGNGHKSPSTAPTAIPEAERCPNHRDQRVGKCRHCRARSLSAKGASP